MHIFGYVCKAVPVGAGAVFMFDKYIHLTYNILNKRTVG